MDGNIYIKMNPPVSIIIPVFNAEKYLAECIESAIAQTWNNLEIIIVDDRSTDRSYEIASKYSVYPKLKIIRQKKNTGASAARNSGFKNATGIYIQFLDADDLLSPNKIEEQINYLRGSITHVALCNTIYFKEEENPYRGILTEDWFCTDSNDPVDFLLKLYAGNEIMPGYGGMIQPNAWLTPRNLIDKAGMWNETLSLDDDGEFFCRVILASEGVKFSNSGVNYYRKHKSSDSLSGQKSLKAFENSVLSTDLKFSYLKARISDPILERIFARHYWWTGVMAYPQFKSLSGYCIEKAKQFGYRGEKYVGGPAGHISAKFLGWKAARYIAWYRQVFNRSWA